MQKALLAVFVLAFMAVRLLTASAQAPAGMQNTFLSALKEGTPVSLKQDAGRYEISTVEGAAAVQGHKVVEIGPDFVVIRDVAGVTESRIPILSIKAIIRLKVPGK